MSDAAPAAWHPRAIVIGASAGGVVALSGLLAALPSSLDCPVLAVLHLPPDRPSMLANLLGKVCRLPVLEAEDKQPIVPGQVLVAPPDYHLLVEDPETVALSADAPELYSRPAIDALFESAAWAWGDGVLALVLTGASEDGARGAARIRAAGGRIWVQRPEDAQADTMPRAALAHAGADAVFSLVEMADQLARLARCT